MRRFLPRRGYRTMFSRIKKLRIFVCLFLAGFLIYVGFFNSIKSVPVQYLPKEGFYESIVESAINPEKKTNIISVIKSFLGIGDKAFAYINASSQVFKYINEDASELDTTFYDNGQNIAELPSSPTPSHANPEETPFIPNEVDPNDAASTAPIEDTTSSANVGAITLINQTQYTPDPNVLKNEPLPFKFDNNGPQILIVHTHTTESYETDIRSTDPNNNMVAVGNAMADEFEKNGIEVIHNTKIHDQPSFNGSYKNCLATVEANLKKYPSIKMVLDVHRDAVVKADGTRVKLSTEINGEKIAQIMMVMGCNEGGLKHPNWQENLKMASKIQQNMMENFPKMARSLNLRKERFNQHTTLASMVLEVGTSANTIAEAKLAAKYSAQAISNIVNANK